MQKGVQWAIVVVILLVVGLAGFMIGRMGGGGGNVADINSQGAEFIQALVSGDVDKTYELGSSDYQANNTAEYIATVSETLGSDSPEVNKEEVFFGAGDAKDHAIYLAEVDNLARNDVGSTTGNFVLRFIKEGNQLKVDSAQIY